MDDEARYFLSDPCLESMTKVELKEETDVVAMKRRDQLADTCLSFFSAYALFMLL